jgi:ATP-dependent exoDNAse (exonuclease V) beta subunit
LKQKPNPSFLIYDASAGSGKTYALVRHYLQTALNTDNPEKYQSILAITFTNKAAQEMKSRVLTQLEEFSSMQILHEPTEIFLEIVALCGTTQQTIQKRAAKTLSHLLQHYGHFSITTIDSLTHQIVRTFARDLGLSSTFELKLETDQFLEQAVDFLIEQTGENKQQTKILTDYVIQKAKDNRSWDISYDLNNIASLVYNESHYKQLRQMSDKTWTDFLKLQKQVQVHKANVIETISNLSKSLYNKVINLKINEASFSHRELLNQLEKGQSKNPSAIPSNRLLSQNENQQLLKKSASKHEQDVLSHLQNDIDEWIDKVAHERKKLTLLNLIERQRVPFSTLHAIYQTTRELQDKQDIRLLSGFNPLLYETINGVPTPFIYERLGVKYTNFYVDEFQDTSVLQWKNLIPLLENATPSTDSAILLVGDAKQSIYRWRGGYPEQFMRLTKGETPFSIPSEVIKLPRNYRSQDTIVTTNNSFFKQAASKLTTPDYQNLFTEGANQETNDKPGGAVTFRFVEGDTLDEREPNYLEAVHQQIIDCESRDYKRNQICVLVRTRNQGVLVTEYLAQQRIDVISSETLLLSQSTTVNVLLSWIRLRSNSTDEVSRKVILDYFRTDQQDPYEWDRSGLKKPIKDFVDQINNGKHAFSYKRFAKANLYEAAEYTIDAFGMTANLCPYLSGFLEEIIQYTNSKASSDNGFLSHWKEVKDRLSIRLTSKKNAVEVMTIHKAKGLEFPVVIFPFAETKIYSAQSITHWLHVTQSEFAGFSSLLVGLNKDFSETSDENQAIYEAARETQALDALNTLYVAMTRPEKELHIVSFDPKKTSDTYADFFVEFVNRNNLIKRADQQYISGDLQRNKASSPPHKPTKSSKWIVNPNFYATFRKSNQFGNQDKKNAVEFGNAFHEIMARIYVKTDVEEAVQFAYSQGYIGTDQLDRLQNVIYQIVHHKELESFFNPNNTQYNERPLLSSDDSPLRPDCFVVLPNKDVAILDYKTGKPIPEHKYQLLQYASFFEKLGRKITQKTIVYVDQKVSLEHIY